MYLLTEKLTSSLIMYMIFKRITRKWTDWKAYENGIIDDKGKRLRKPKTSKEREGWDILDRFCWSIKRLCTKYINDSIFAYYFSAAYLMKEQATIIFNSDKNKYLSELNDMTIEKQKILLDCINEMNYNNIIVESHINLELNLLKIVNITKPIIEKYDLSFLNEDESVATTGTALDDIAQFTPRLGSTIKRKFKRKIKLRKKSIEVTNL